MYNIWYILYIINIYNYIIPYWYHISFTHHTSLVFPRERNCAVQWSWRFRGPWHDGMSRPGMITSHDMIPYHDLMTCHNVLRCHDSFACQSMMTCHGTEWGHVMTKKIIMIMTIRIKTRKNEQNMKKHEKCVMSKSTAGIIAM